MTIDWWTLGIQTVNVVILIWLLGRFFWRPVAAMIEQRAPTAQQDSGRGASASATERPPRARRSSARSPRRGNAKRRRQPRPRDRRGPRCLEAGRDEQPALREAAKAAIEKEKEAADKAWRAERASRLRSKSRGQPPGWCRRSCVPPSWTGSSKEIRSFPEPAQRRCGRNARCVEATSAVTAAATSERFTEGARRSLAHPDLLEVTVEPALIAGLELDGPHLVVSNSWRADLIASDPSWFP